MKNNKNGSSMKTIKIVISLLLILSLFSGLYPKGNITVHASESEFSDEATITQSDGQVENDPADDNITNIQPQQQESDDPVSFSNSPENELPEQETEDTELSESGSEGLESGSENNFDQAQISEGNTDFEDDLNEHQSFESEEINNEQSSSGAGREEPEEKSQERETEASPDILIDENDESFNWDWNDHIEQEESQPADDHVEEIPALESDMPETGFEPVADTDAQDIPVSEDFLLEESEEQQVTADSQNSYLESKENALQIQSSILQMVAGESIWLETPSYDAEIDSAESSNPAIAYVDRFIDNSAVIVGKKPGKAVISLIDNNGTVTKRTVQVLSIFNSTTVSVVAGQTREIELRYYLGDDYYDGDYRITSSNTKVVKASIDDYYMPSRVELEGIEPGKATLTIRHNPTGATSQLSVTVIKPPFALNRTNVTLRASNIQYIKSSDSIIKSAASSNTKIVKTQMESDGRAKLIPVKPGSAVVTVKNQYGTAKKIPVKIVSFLKFKTITVTAGKNRFVYPEKFYNAEDYYSWTTVFSSHNKNVATAYKNDYWEDYEEKIVFTGLKPGKTAVYVKCGKTGATCTITVNVKAPAFNLKSSKVTVKTDSNCDVTTSGSKLGAISSSNTGIVTAKKINDSKLRIIPVSSGQATLTVSSVYGVKRQLTVVVARSYFKQALTNKTKLSPVVYGTTALTGTTAAFSTVSTTIGGKTYSAAADAEGNFSIKNVPFVKIGASVKVTFRLQGYSISRSATVTKGKSTLYTPYYTYKDTTSVPVEVTNAHSGDKLIITINGRSFYRTIKQSYSKITPSVAIKKTNKYGIKMTVKLLNKFGQELASYNDYVYHSDTVHVGDTKAKVRWLTGWNDPVRKEYHSYGETWCYDWDDEEGEDAYLYFDADGKVTDWWIIE